LRTAPRPGGWFGHQHPVETPTGDCEKVMSSQELLTSPPRDSADLAAACLEHLEQEEASLLATREALRQLHAALLHGGVDVLARVLPLQERAAQASEEQHRKRMQAVQEWATFLGISPEHITLTLLVD